MAFFKKDRHEGGHSDFSGFFFFSFLRQQNVTKTRKHIQTSSTYLCENITWKINGANPTQISESRKVETDNSLLICFPIRQIIYLIFIANEVVYTIPIILILM